jgi:DnaJ like chaperone protein
MSFVFVLGLLGLLVGGVRGLLWGAVLGYAITRLLPYVLHKGLTAVQSQFVESTFAVMGALCKADGVITRDEIQVVETIFERLNLSEEQRIVARSAFSRGKAAGFDLDAEVSKFSRVSRGQRALAMVFLQLQISAVAADGAIHPAEHQMLVRIARGLGLSEADVAQLEALLRTGAGARGPSPQQKLDDAYAALGLTPSATDAQVKQAYRRLMSQNHPDKLAAKGLPESMRAVAEQRAREISVAYAHIKEARGFI